MQRLDATAISDRPFQIDRNSPINSLISYEKTMRNGVEVTSPVFYSCITAFKEYENKSLEELRLEDYFLNRKYPRIIPPPFKININIPVSTEGTKKHKYKEVLGVDLKFDKNSKIQYPLDTVLTHICCMLEYENLSPEELRFYDYKNGLKSKIKNDKNNNVETNDLGNCPICLETIINLKRDGIRLNVSICGHVICKQCTQQLYKNANKSRLECPSCRKQLKANEIHELFI